MNRARQILAHGEFADIDRHFAEFIERFAGGDELPVIAAGFLSYVLRQNHICLDLDAGPPVFEQAPPEFEWPGLREWRKALERCPAVGDADGVTPLVLTGAGRLYLRRYWEYETSLAAAILSRCESGAPVAAHEDAQQLAIETAVARRITIVSGGPGTGKTTTVLKVLDRLIREAGNKRLRIALTAPTGKAAARMLESLREGCAQFGIPAQVGEQLPQASSTLHRLLGSRKGSVYFRHDARNPLPVDLVVVDESSMAPLPLMAKLFEALPAAARVILLGDRDQLASVEPGNVLGDIAAAAALPGGPLNGSLVVLHKNYRFGNDSHIFQLSCAVRDRDPGRVFEILASGEKPDLAGSPIPSARDLRGKLRSAIVRGYSDYLKQSEPAEALRELQKFRVLCALRRGPHGVNEINGLIQELLREEKLIPPGVLYRGLPVLITRNDYPLRLFNGDIGVLLPDPAIEDDPRLWAWFFGENNQLRRIPPARLPAHEPAFAMTVHKSQGSEFDKVLLILPDRTSAVVGRELVYTGLTRARSHVEIWYAAQALEEAIGAHNERVSGLQEALSGKD